MPEDLRSRFIGEIWKYPTPSQIKKVIDWEKIYINCNNPNVSNGYSQSSQNQVAVPISHEIKELVNDRIFPGLITFIKDIHALRMKGDVEYSLSIRDVNQFFNQFFKNHFDPNSKNALEQTFSQTVLFKFEDPAERELIKVRIQDTFGGKL